MESEESVEWRVPPKGGIPLKGDKVVVISGEDMIVLREGEVLDPRVKAERFFMLKERLACKDHINKKGDEQCL